MSSSSPRHHGPVYGASMTTAASPSRGPPTIGPRCSTGPKPSICGLRRLGLTFRGRTTRVLVTRGHLQTDDYQLTGRCQRWVKGLKAKFVSTPLAPAAPIVSRLVARA